MKKQIILFLLLLITIISSTSCEYETEKECIKHCICSWNNYSSPSFCDFSYEPCPEKIDTGQIIFGAMFAALICSLASAALYLSFIIVYRYCKKVFGCYQKIKTYNPDGF